MSRAASRGPAAIQMNDARHRWFVKALAPTTGGRHAFDCIPSLGSCRRRLCAEVAGRAAARSASNQAKAIANKAELQAAPLDQQADALSNQAKQAGGYTGKRLEVKADALQQEAKLIREQADKQGDAIKEAADARIKTIQSR